MAGGFLARHSKIKHYQANKWLGTKTFQQVSTEQRKKSTIFKFVSAVVSVEGIHVLYIFCTEYHFLYLI